MPPGAILAAKPFLEHPCSNLSSRSILTPAKMRGHNEDFFVYAEPRTPEQVRSHGWLFVLADGCGGHDRGEVASQLAVETLVTSFYASPAGDAAAFRCNDWCSQQTREFAIVRPRPARAVARWQRP